MAFQVNSIWSYTETSEISNVLRLKWKSKTLSRTTFLKCDGLWPWNTIANFVKITSRVFCDNHTENVWYFRWTFLSSQIFHTCCDLLTNVKRWAPAHNSERSISKRLSNIFQWYSWYISAYVMRVSLHASSDARVQFSVRDGRRDTPAGAEPIRISQYRSTNSYLSVIACC